MIPSLRPCRTLDRPSLARGELDRQGGEADLELRRRALETRRVDLPLADTTQELLEQHPALEARQVDPDAVVRAVAEAQVAAGTPAHLEAVGVLELAFVAVRRLQQEEEALAVADAEAADFQVGLRRAPDRLEHALVAHHLLEGAGYERRFGRDGGALVRMAR